MYSWKLSNKKSVQAISVQPSLVSSAPFCPPPSDSLSLFFYGADCGVRSAPESPNPVWGHLSVLEFTANPPAAAVSPSTPPPTPHTHTHPHTPPQTHTNADLPSLYKTPLSLNNSHFQEVPCGCVTFFSILDCTSAKVRDDS